MYLYIHLSSNMYLLYIHITTPSMSLYYTSLYTTPYHLTSAPTYSYYNYNNSHYIYTYIHLISLTMYSTPIPLIAPSLYIYTPHTLLTHYPITP